MKTEIQVVGVKEALRELNSIDVKARRQLTRDFKEIMKPVTRDAQQLIPKKAPLSGFDRSWTPRGSTSPILPYSGAVRPREPKRPTAREMNYSSGRRAEARWQRWQAGLNAYVSGKRPQTIGDRTRNLAAFGLKWQGPAAVLFDTSGRSSTAQGAQMVEALNAKFGSPSRVMWRAWASGGDDVQANVARLIKHLMATVGRRIELDR